MRRQLKIGFVFLMILPTLVALALSGCGRSLQAEQDEAFVPRISRVGDNLVYDGYGEVPLTNNRTLSEAQVGNYARQAMDSLQNSLGYFRNQGVSESLLSPMEHDAQSLFQSGGPWQTGQLANNAVLAEACKTNLNKILRLRPDRRQQAKWRAERCLAVHSANQEFYLQNMPYPSQVYVGYPPPSGYGPQGAPQPAFPPIEGLIRILITLLVGAG